MSEPNTWLVILAIDKETIRGFYEGVVPMSYKPTSEARWCMVRADTKERAIELAEASHSGDLAPGESFSAASISRWCDHEILP